MFTFDKFSDLADPIKEMSRSKMPDVIEAAETNEHWVEVRRSKREVRFISKVTGNVTLYIPIDRLDAMITGLSKRQLAAIKDLDRPSSYRVNRNQ